MQFLQRKINVGCFTKSVTAEKRERILEHFNKATMKSNKTAVLAVMKYKQLQNTSF